jgi:transcriptional regulator with XRE-family HTH domain
MHNDPMDSEELARRCRKERNAKGLTQEELGERMGATKQAVSKAENRTARDGMDRFRVKMLEELTGRDVRGPLWKMEDAPSTEPK